jgi:hypothetical protein
MTQKKSINIGTVLLMKYKCVCVYIYIYRKRERGEGRKRMEAYEMRKEIESPIFMKFVFIQIAIF